MRRVCLTGESTESRNREFNSLTRVAQDLEAYGTAARDVGPRLDDGRCERCQALCYIMTDALCTALRWNMLGSYESHLNRYVKHETLRTVLKWPVSSTSAQIHTCTKHAALQVIFLGVSPQDAPALYSMMASGGHLRGTWYPQGGMSTPAKALAAMAQSKGVEFQLSRSVTELVTAKNDDKISAVCTVATSNTAEQSQKGQQGGQSCTQVDGVVATADYEYVEQHLLPPRLRRYDTAYWRSRQLSPSCLLYFLAFNRTIPGLLHHTFFFDSDLDGYVSCACSSITVQQSDVHLLRQSSARRL